MLQSPAVHEPPRGFTNNQITSKDLEDRINEKFSNKVWTRIIHFQHTFLNHGQVVQKVGLCISMYDLLKASDGLIGTGTGNVNVNGMVMYVIQGLI
jgi:DNA-directed RNA polymerase III subunit RPC8